MLNTLRFADELRTASDLGLKPPAAREAALSSKELAMAERLIEEMSAPWDPKHYHDTYREDLMGRIEEKVRKHETHSLPEIQKEPAPRKGAEVIDLLEVLKQSLEKGGGGGGRRAASHQEKLGRRKSARA